MKKSAFIAVASLLAAPSISLGADFAPPNTYTGGLSDNAFSLNSGGISATFVDPDNSGCNYTGSFAGGTFLPTATCNGDEFFHIDSSPTQAVPGSSSLGNTISSDFSSNPPNFQYGADVRSGSQATFTYGDITTANGVVSDFYSTNIVTPSAAIGLDVSLGAFTDPADNDELASVPMELFIDLDPNGTGGAPLPGSNNFADLLYITAVSESSIVSVTDEFSFTNTFFGMAGQAQRNGNGFGAITGDVDFLYNWRGIQSFQFAFGADEFFQRTIRDGDTLATSGSLNISVEREVVQEPLTILGTGTAIAFGAGFKRKLAKAKKK